MSIVKIIGEKFKLASRWKRFCALLLDIGLCAFLQCIVFLGGYLEILVLENFFFLDTYDANTLTIGTMILLSVVLWIFGIFFMDGVKKGGGFGKRLLSLQIVRLRWKASKLMGRFRATFFRHISTY